MVGIWDFKDYSIKDICRIRDSLETLDGYGLANEDMLNEVKQEIKRRCENE